MTLFVASDLHFGHKNILKFCPDSRPFSSVEEMNESIIERHNSLVSPQDTTYMLGDIAFCSGSDAAKMINRMNGKKILVVGNHDKANLKQPSFRAAFEEIHDYLSIRLPAFDNLKVCMFHFPIYSWDEQHYGSIHLHGHLHGKPTGLKGRIMDVGLDTNNCYPYRLEDVVKQMLAIQFKNEWKDGK